jgi:hypothetical protein
MSFEEYLRRHDDGFVSRFLFCMTAFTGIGMCLGILIITLALRFWK